MGNMSYARFRNTATDLRDCLDNMEPFDLSEEEAKARLRIIRMAVEIVEDFGHEVTP